MTIPNSLDDLFEQSFRIVFRKSSILVWFQIPVQTATRYIFHHKDHVLRSVNYLVQFDELLVVYFFHQLNFAFDWLTPVRVHEFVLFVNLHCYFAVGRFVKTHSDNCIRSLAYLLANYVFVERRLFAEDHAVFLCRSRVFFLDTCNFWDFFDWKDCWLSEWARESSSFRLVNWRLLYHFRLCLLKLVVLVELVQELLLLVHIESVFA